MLQADLTLADPQSEDSTYKVLGNTPARPLENFRVLPATAPQPQPSSQALDESFRHHSFGPQASSLGSQVSTVYQGPGRTQI